MDVNNLIKEYESKIDFREVSFKSPKLKGLCIDDTVFYHKGMTGTEKLCIVAEELGHYETSTGTILGKDTNSMKQERKARKWAANKLISFDQIIKANREGVQNRFELAEYLDVTEDFLQETIDLWKQKYGLCVSHGNYLITLEPFDVRLGEFL